MIQIGSWYRLGRGRKWHLVESVIDNDPVTRCGRRLNRREGDKFSPTPPYTRMIGQPDFCKAGCE